MAQKEKIPACVQPTTGPILPGPEPAPIGGGPRLGRGGPRIKEEVRKMIARVGKEAPDFETNAFVDGGFKNIKLSDYRGQWVVLCFYPGDFTFV